MDRHSPLVRPLDAGRVYFLYNAAIAFFLGLITTVNLVYFVRVAGLDPLQMVLVGTALELSIFLLEVPTGALADTYSRRISIILGTALMGAGFLLQAAVPRFAPILLAQLVWGGGYTFTSGALQAWISDEAGEERAARFFLRGEQAAVLGGLLSVPLSAWLGGTSLQLPMVLGSLLFFGLALFLLAFMPEQNWRPASGAAGGTLHRLAGTLRGGVRAVRYRPALVHIFAIGLFFGLYSEGYDRLWTPLLLERFPLEGLLGWPEIYWFGLLRLVGDALSFLSLAVVERLPALRESPARLARTLTVLTAVLVAALMAFALAPVLWLAAAAYWIIAVLRQTAYPLFLAWINRRLDPSVRATVLSAYGQVDAVGQIAGGPLVGLIARGAGLTAGLLSSAVLLSPAVALLASLARRGRPADEEDLGPAAV